MIILLVTGAITASLAQTSSSSKFSINFEAGKPVGEASNFYSSVIGGSLKYQTPIIEDGTFFTASAGYSVYYTAARYEHMGIEPSFGFIPVQAGVKVYLYKGFFMGVEVGDVIATASGFDNKFAYSLHTGYSFKRMEIGAHYESWAGKTVQLAQVGAYIGYRF
ncbi:hypothetical protein FFF34_001265 [Inquilinus sp. KBS0705]|nr:hypothetical protein FFF34_001265 [Inquilinus sp. KBS0705]